MIIMTIMTCNALQSWCVLHSRHPKIKKNIAKVALPQQVSHLHLVSLLLL